MKKNPSLKRIETKKGQGLVEVFSWFLALTFTVLFFIFFNMSGCKGNPAEQKITSISLTDLKVSYDINSYLRTPVEYKNIDITIADLLVLAMDNEELTSRLIVPNWFSFFPMTLSQLNTIENIFDQDFAAAQDHPLSSSAVDLMRTYTDYIPSAANKEWFCSLKLEARKGNRRLVLYDARYNWYKANLCTYEYVLAETMIPDNRGGQIQVMMLATVDSGAVAATMGKGVASVILFPYTAPYELIRQGINLVS
jgi:hypothetical protein